MKVRKLYFPHFLPPRRTMGTGKFFQFLIKGVETIGLCMKQLWQWVLAAV